jgi:hypothetical protein
LWIELQWTWVCKYLSCILICTSWDMFPRVVVWVKIIGKSILFFENPP